MNLVKVNNDLQEKLRYIFSTGFFALLDLSMTYVFVEYFGLSVLFGSFVSGFILIIGFLVQKIYVFKNKNNKYFYQLIKYFSNVLLQMILGLLLLYFFTSIFGIWYIYAILIIKIIFFVANYFIYKFLIF